MQNALFRLGFGILLLLATLFVSDLSLAAENFPVVIGHRSAGEIHPLLLRPIKAGLLVHAYTLRAEERFLTLHANGLPQSIAGEVIQLLGLGVNGFFIDQPIHGVRAGDRFLELNGVERETARGC